MTTTDRLHRHVQRRRDARGDRGWTMVEMLVLVLIAGIILGAAVPIWFDQREKGLDASVQTDLDAYAEGADAHFTAKFYYPMTLAGFALTGEKPQMGRGNDFRAFVVRSGPDAGYVIYGQNNKSLHVYVLSSYDTPVKPRLVAGIKQIPEYPPQAQFGVPADVTPSDWTSTGGIGSTPDPETRTLWDDPSFIAVSKPTLSSTSTPQIAALTSAPFRVIDMPSPVASRAVHVNTSGATGTAAQGVILSRHPQDATWPAESVKVAAAGEKWTASAWVQTDANREMTIGCRYSDAMRAAVTPDPTKDYADFKGTGSWQRVSVTCTTSGSHVGKYVNVLVALKVQAPAVNFYVTAPQVDTGAGTTPFQNQ